jgi:dienelactone hydrolase
MLTQDIDYQDGAARLRGFLAYDETARDRRPGVLVFHEGLGLNEHAMERARMVAGLGYVALAADMFGDRRQAGKVKASLLVCTGADDPLAPADQVIAFEEEMRAAGVADWQVISYGNTLHGFANPAADGSILPSALYNERSDRRSWAAMRDFFNEAFGSDARGGR